MTGRVQSVERSIDILMALSTGPHSLTQVARMTGLSKGTTHRLLATLDHEGLVLKNTLDNMYMLGPGILRLVRGAARGIGSIALLAEPALTKLRDQTGETVTLHVSVGVERICIEEIPSLEPVRYSAPVGSRAPLHVGSAGKVLLAFEDPEELERALTMLPLDALTPDTITDPQSLREELAMVRQNGWASSHGERVPDAAAVSVPVFSNGRIVASLSLLGPASRLTDEVRIRQLPDLRKAAAAFETVLAKAAVATTGNEGTSQRVQSGAAG